MKKYICIDIGGTAIKHGVADEGLRLLEKSEIPTKSQVDGGPGIVKKVLKKTGGAATISPAWQFPLRVWWNQKREESSIPVS